MDPAFIQQSIYNVKFDLFPFQSITGKRNLVTKNLILKVVLEGLGCAVIQELRPLVEYHIIVLFSKGYNPKIYYR